MDNANLDILPSSERFRQRHERMKRGPKEYAEQRAERVGDQVGNIAEDMERNEELSELLIALHEEETTLKEQLGGDLENCTGALQNYDAKQWEDLLKAFTQGRYTFTVETGKNGKPEIGLALDLPEGNVKEKIPLTQTVQEAIASHARGQGSAMRVCPACGKTALVEGTIKHRRVWKCRACGHTLNVQ